MRRAANNAFLCLSLAVCFLHWPVLLGDLMAAVLFLRALQWGLTTVPQSQRPGSNR